MQPTSANTASTLVSRDGSGNFIAGTITAALTGTASKATILATTRNIAVSGAVTGNINFDGSANVTIITAYKASGVVAGTYRSVTVDTAGTVTGGTNPTTIAGYGLTDAAPIGHVTSTGDDHTWLDQSVTTTSSPSFYKLNIARISGQPNIKSAGDGYMMIDSTGMYTAINYYVADNVLLAYGGGKVGVGVSPGTKLDVGTVVADTIRSFGGFVGNATASIGGTGAAAHFPTGLYSLGPNWIYGTTTFNSGVSGVTNFSCTGTLSSNNGRLVMRDNSLEDWATNASSALAINYAGYAAGSTQFRDLAIYNGKGSLIASFVGSTQTAYFTGDVIADGIGLGATGNEIWANANTSLCIGYRGIGSSITEYQTTNIGDGKMGLIASFVGGINSTVSITGKLNVSSTLTANYVSINSGVGGQCPITIKNSHATDNWLTISKDDSSRTGYLGYWSAYGTDLVLQNATTNGNITLLSSGTGIIKAIGAITSSSTITSADAIYASGAGGFLCSSYVVNGRSKIYELGNAPGYGLSFFQGTAGVSGDTIGIHFNTTTAATSQFQFNANGSLKTLGTVTAPSLNISGDAGFGSIGMNGHITMNCSAERQIRFDNNYSAGIYGNDTSMGIFDWAAGASVLAYDQVNPKLTITPPLTANAGIFVNNRLVQYLPGVDFNTIVSEWALSDGANNPSTGFCYVNTVMYSSTSQKRQIAYGYQNNYMFVRYFYGAVWSDWDRVMKLSDVTQAATAGQIVERDASADVNARLFRSNYADSATVGGGLAFRFDNAGNNYIRFCNSPSAVRTWLGVGTGDTPYFANASVDNLAVGGESASDVIDGSPWHGVGKMNWNFDAFTAPPVQLGGYYGVRIRAATAYFDVHPNYIASNARIEAAGGYEYLGKTIAAQATYTGIAKGAGATFTHGLGYIPIVVISNTANSSYGLTWSATASAVYLFHTSFSVAATWAGTIYCW